MGITPLSRDTQRNGIQTFYSRSLGHSAKKWSLCSGVAGVDSRGENGVTTNSLGGEVVLDFMFWPSAKHRLGWYLEPGYYYDFGRGHERSVGL